MHLRIFFLVLFVLFTCNVSGPVYDALDFSYYEAFSLQPLDLTEASGLAASYSHKEILYSMNDSGNKNEIFILDYKAHDLGKIILKGVNNRDWEDIVVGPGPGDRQYIYVAEIGDNLAQFDVKYIYRFPEPVITTSSRNDIEITSFDSIRFRFPDGKRDAEALLLEPLTKDLYIFSKREDTVGIYLAAYPQSIDSIITLKKVGQLATRNVVAGSISRNGEHVLLKTYDKVMYWNKDVDQPLYDVINYVPPVFFPYEVEPQGESITWHPFGNGYFTLSEEPGNHESSLYHYKRK